MHYHRYLPVSLPLVRGEAVNVVVIGTGVAGLSAALAAAENNDVLLLSKEQIEETNTHYAQGGIASAIGRGDSPSQHFEDTLRAGVGLCDEPVTRALVDMGPTGINYLLELGAKFDRLDDGQFALTREGAHNRSRILHAGGDATGEEIRVTLARAARTHPRIRIVEGMAALDLITEQGACVGVWVLDQAQQVVKRIDASAVVLATGGCGHVYAHTTNSSVITGDGLAMAFRAGAKLMDMEFIQFHPTALSLDGAPHFLISEAVRGEGAVLRNIHGDRFMLDIHEMAELAPRDVVARAIYEQMNHDQSGHVLLDSTHQSEETLRRRFPTIFATCLQYGLNMAREPIPVAPAQHYTMGGIQVDMRGQTSIAGLYACGEAACLSVHGANRLASNSLLDGLVFGRWLGGALGPLPRALPGPVSRPSGAVLFATGEDQTQYLRQQQRQIVWSQAGIVRDAGGLRSGLASLEQIARQLPVVSTRAHLELYNMTLVGHLILQAASYRTESRGGHFRSDWPVRDDARWRCHTVLRKIDEQQVALDSAVVQQIAK